jgi:hypothetical protein
MGRWTDIAEWVGPTVNEGDGDGRPGEPEDRMTGHVGLVVHIAEGTFEGTTSWERNPVAEVSSHFIVAKTGEIRQMVDTDDRSWCQSAGNPTWISVENEGYHTQAPTPEQVEALAKIFAKCMQVYDAPGRLTDSVNVGGLGWHGMGGAAWGGHYDCPGDQFKAARPAILARALEIMGGDDVTIDDVRKALAEVVVFGGDSMGPGVPDPLPESVKGNSLVDLLQHIVRELDALKAAQQAGGVDVAALAEALKPELQPLVGDAVQARLQGARISGTVSGSVSGSVSGTIVLSQPL